MEDNKGDFFIAFIIGQQREISFQPSPAGKGGHALWPGEGPVCGGALQGYNRPKEKAKAGGETSMLCHAFAERVECHDGGRPVTIAPAGADSADRIAFLCALHEELVSHFQKRDARHAAIEYQNLGMAKKKVNRHVGEVTAMIVGAALHAGASVEQS